MFDTSVEVALRVLLPRLSIEVLLDLGHAAVSLGAKAQLDLDESLEGGVEVGNTQVDKLGQLSAELLVELLVGSLGHVLFLLGTGELGHILVRFVDEALDFGAQGIVVEELVAAFLDACGWKLRSAHPIERLDTCVCGKGHTFVHIGKIGAEPGDGLQNSSSTEGQQSAFTKVMTGHPVLGGCRTGMGHRGP